MVFFGVHLVLVGTLVRSSLLSRVAGTTLVLAGACYAANSFARFVVPAFAARLFPYVLWPRILAEAALMFSLLFLGLRGPRGLPTP